MFLDFTPFGVAHAPELLCEQVAYDQVETIEGTAVVLDVGHVLV